MKSLPCFRPARATLLALLLAAAGLAEDCAVGPRYQRPEAPVAAGWQVRQPWREGAPRDAWPKGEWWAVFQDGELDALEKEALTANQTLRMAEAHYAQARAAVRLELAPALPRLDLAPNAERQRLSGNRPTNGPLPLSGPYTQSSYALPFTVSYEVDLFGRRRRSVEAAQAASQATAAELGNARLVVGAELAGEYFSLRQLDSQLATLERTVAALEKGLELVRSRHDGGIASGLDVAQEETLLRTTQTRATLLLQQRKQLEDAIAVLVGRPAPEFHLERRDLASVPPALSPGLPSDLLERRPDVARAERLMAVANAEIGIARAAYFPSVTLSGGGGWLSSSLGSLLKAASTFWAIGASVAENVLSGGARGAQVEFARAGYQASVASYRETVLNAFSEVQDEITALQVLEEAAMTQEQAVAAARRSLEIATSRYVGGLVSYLDVVNAQESLLASEEQMVVLRGERLLATVRLIKALGGGWDPSSLAAARIRSEAASLLRP